MNAMCQYFPDISQGLVLSQHSDTISAIRLQSYIAVSGLHLDYTERKIQSLGNVLKVLAHGIHQAVRFTWV